MTSTAEHVALVALLRRQPPHRWQQYTPLLEQAGSALALLDADLSGSSPQTSLLPEPTQPLLLQAAADIQRWDADGYRLVSVLDPGYPANLREVHDRPPLVFIDGRLIAADDRAVAIIGARDASPTGCTIAARFATELSDAGYTIVSGLATGIDAAAHTAALATTGRTIAVIGTGLGHTYPPQHADLQRRIATHGAVVSQFWPDERPTRTSFPMRNAVMSGISRGSVVIEASERSGARTQARLALAHGRPVFLHTRLLEQPWARELAAAPGAHVVDTPADVERRLSQCPPSTT